MAECKKKSNYYIKHESMPYEEDSTHEFKGHRNICFEELRDGTTRKSVSRNLCGFLNTGMGGTVYCGVADDGMILGIKLTQCQRDHVVGSLHDLMSRYDPPVPKYRYTIKFVPVFEPTTKEDDCIRMASFNPGKYLDIRHRSREHLFRTSQPCWCEEDAKSVAEYGIITCDYIIELTIHPWEPNNPKYDGIGELLNVHPIFANEEGRVYFRRLASIKQYSFNEIAQIADEAAAKRYREIIQDLDNQINLLSGKLEKKTAE